MPIRTKVDSSKDQLSNNYWARVGKGTEDKHERKHTRLQDIHEHNQDELSRITEPLKNIELCIPIYIRQYK